MKTVIGVMGPGEKNATKEDLGCAYEVGKMVARTGSVLLTGGTTGTMEAACRGAHEGGGLVVGVCPTYDKSDLNTYVDIPIVTGMREGRNFMNILSSDVLVFVSVGSMGTLSELAFALKQKKPSLIIRGSEKLEAYIAELKSDSVLFVKTLPELEKALNTLIVRTEDSV